MAELQKALERRWRKLFDTLVAGDDVAPAQRLRTEGIMEAAVLLAIATPAELTAGMERSYREAYGHTIADDFGADWQDFFEFPQIPAMARRAPVYPSTRD